MNAHSAEQSSNRMDRPLTTCSTRPVHGPLGAAPEPGRNCRTNEWSAGKRTSG